MQSFQAFNNMIQCNENKVYWKTKHSEMVT